MALPFAGDENVDVRALAGHALVRLGGAASPLGPAAFKRAIALAQSDGTLLSTVMLDASHERPELLNPEGTLYYRLVPLVDHPAESVRRKARAVLAS